MLWHQAYQVNDNHTFVTLQSLNVTSQDQSVNSLQVYKLPLFPQMFFFSFSGYSTLE